MDVPILLNLGLKVLLNQMLGAAVKIRGIYSIIAAARPVVPLLPWLPELYQLRVLVMVAAVIVVTFVVDLIYGLVDPRLRSR